MFETISGKQELLFMLFDALVVDEKNLTKREYTSRLGYLRKYVMEPYIQSCQKKPNYHRIFPFKLTQKRLEFSFKLPKVFDQMEKAKHKTDGVIFTSAVAPYVFGTCDKMLKWKPAEENTIDFKLLLNEDKGGI